jgi:hypothetical protein
VKTTLRRLGLAAAVAALATTCALVPPANAAETAGTVVGHLTTATGKPATNTSV